MGKPLNVATALLAHNLRLAAKVCLALLKARSQRLYQGFALLQFCPQLYKVRLCPTLMCTSGCW